MELRQLRYFVAVADTLNFSRAAESLYVSQSALSKQISELEQELGVALFDRDRRSVALTSAGQLLLPEAKDILMRSEKLVPLLRHEAEDALPDRTIHIAVEPRADDDSLIHRVLTNAVYQQRRQLPGLRALFWREEYMEIKKVLPGWHHGPGYFPPLGANGGRISGQCNIMRGRDGAGSAQPDGISR